MRRNRTFAASGRSGRTSTSKLALALGLVTILGLCQNATAAPSSWKDGLQAPRADFFETVLEGNVANQKSCKPTGLIHDACCDYQTVEDVNNDLASRLDEIIQLPFFRFQKVNLFQECAFWQEDGSCMNRACAVQETDEDHVPEAWKSGTLGKVKEALAFPNALQGALAKDSDFCVLDEDSPSSDDIYVDLYENPERFTGYAGASANKVWKAIYEENCFDVVPFMAPSRGQESGGSGYLQSSLLGDRSKSVRSLMGNLGLAAPRDTQDEEQCLEKRVYYRLISGLHASISIHICAEYLDQETGQWKPNLACFITRIAEHPERLQNVYFNYVLMLRALTKAAPYLRQYNYNTGDKGVDTRTKQLVTGLLDKAESCQATFDETSMFSGPEAKILKQEFKSHFRNVSRIMDCVGCDKCRLWGKTQVTGVATGLKLLFSCDDTSSSTFNNDFELRRSEIVAFVWTLHRFSESLAAVEQFREMWAKRDQAEGTPLVLRRPSQEELKQDAVESATPSQSTNRSGPEGKEHAEPAIFSPPTRHTDAPASEKKTRPSEEQGPVEVDPHDTIQDSVYHAEAGTTAIGPRLSSILAKLYNACRSSIAACFAIVERSLSFISGFASERKSEL